MTTSAPPRRPRTKRGPGEPRHLILPAGIVSSGWPAVRDTSERIGIRYDDWQQDFNRALLAKDSQGLYAADTAVMSICRQSGKTFDLGGVVFADSIITPGTTTVWTAHRFKVSRESFNEMRAWARRPELAPHIEYDDITTAAGNECIPFRNGSRILFAARERGAIRGFTKVRRLILDEAQILTEAAMSDLVPTTNQAENPQIILMGTPPKPTDPGEVFTALRTAALAGELDGVLYIEFSADEDCDIDDWDAVAEANPSYPKRTSQRAVLRLRKLLTNDDDYRREGLGIWSHGLQSEQVIPAGAWARCSAPDAERGARVAYSIDAAPDGTSAAIAASDGLTSVVLEHGPGTSWVPVKMAALLKRKPGPVVLDPRSPAGALLVDLTEHGITTEDVSPQQHAQACGGILAAITHDGNDRRFQHTNQPHLNAAVTSAIRRTYGDAWAWSRRNSKVDISPLVAVTLARWGALTFEDGPSVYEDRGLMSL
jgi:hypothetical protein